MSLGSSIASAGSKPKKTRRRSVEYGRYGIYFILPFFIVYGLFQLYPLIDTVFTSTQEHYYRGSKEVGPIAVGLENFKSVLMGKNDAGKMVLFNTDTFKAIYNTLVMWLMNFVPQILLSLVLAAWFTDTKVKLKGQGA